MFSPKVSDLWTENRFFLILFSRREWVGNPNQSIFPVPVVQLSPNFLHMVLNSLPRYHAKNFLIVSPFVYFLVYSLIKIPSLAEIPSWPGQRELPIGDFWQLMGLCYSYLQPRQDGGTSKIQVNTKVFTVQMGHPVHQPLKLRPIC